MQRATLLWAALALAASLPGCKCSEGIAPCEEGASCDDGNACTTGDVCAKSVCAGEAVDCGAAGSCRGAKSCDPKGAAGNCDVVGDPVNEGGVCSDGDPCTTGDACAAGACKGAAVVCAAGSPCRAAPSCDPSGADGNCALPGEPANEGVACDDSDPCTVGEACAAGACSGGKAPACAAATTCRAAAACDPAGAAGNCAAGAGALNEGGSCGYGQACRSGECLFDGCAARTGSLEVQGLEAGGEGGAAWNTAAGAPEPEKQGHDIAWTPTCVLYAYYYFATRDYVDDAATGGLHLTGASEGFEGFKAALADAGLGLGDVTMRISVMSLGADASGTDWTYDPATTTEVRHYTGGQMTLLLAGEALVGGAMPPLHVTAEYGSLTDCTDDKIAGRTDFFVPEDESAASSAKVKAAAQAFLHDVGKYGVRLVYDSLQPVGQTEFDAGGRKGAWFEAQSGRFEIGTAPIGACP